MKKIFITILTLCTACILAVTAYGETMSESGDWVYWVKDDGTAVITVPAGATVNNNNIVIPSEVDGYKVTEIGNYCFSSQLGIFTAEIPSSVTIVGSKAFSDCYGLSTVSFGLDFSGNGEGTQVIGEGAFMNCYGLETVYFPDTLKNIKAEAFSNCSALSSVSIPYGTEIIGNSAFANCNKLTSVILPTTIKELGGNAFNSCPPFMVIYFEGTKDEWDAINKDESNFNDTEVVFLSEGLFSATDEPDDIVGKNGRDGNFSYLIMEDCTAELTGYHGVEQDVVIPSEVDGYTVSKVGFACFSFNRKIISVEIPSSVKVIDDCFAYCTNLETITLHEGLEVIGDDTFKSCEKLKSITLPSTVTEIGKNAFDECKMLEKVTFGKSVTKIGEYCFDNCENISRIEIPDGVTTIEEGIFSDCENLTEIVIPTSVVKITRYAFEDCNNLEKILYKGTEKDWKNIFIHYDNKLLFECLKIYEYDPETYKPVGPEFAIILCGILILAAVAVVLILMCRKAKTCPDCGRKLEEDSEFCGWCGKEL